jgi:hypothetical protein
MGFVAVAVLMTAVVGTTMYGIYHASWDGHLDWQSATLGRPSIVFFALLQKPCWLNS